MGREEDRGIRSAKLSPSFSHVVRLRVGGEIVGDKGRKGGRFAGGDNRMEQRQQFVTLISQPTITATASRPSKLLNARIIKRATPVRSRSAPPGALTLFGL